jgi:hypothetical protein
MEIVAALIVYVIVTIGLIIILIRSNIRTFSAIVISMIIGQILMNIICPPPSIDPWADGTSSTALYYLIQIATPIIVYIYALIKGFEDKNNRI